MAIIINAERIAVDPSKSSEERISRYETDVNLGTNPVAKHRVPLVLLIEVFLDEFLEYFHSTFKLVVSRRSAYPGLPWRFAAVRCTHYTHSLTVLHRSLGRTQ